MNNYNDKQQFISNIYYHFNLRQKKEDKPTPIYLVLNLNKKQYKYPIGCKVMPSQWNDKTERPVISSYLTQLDNKNNSIVKKKIMATEIKVKEIFDYICDNPEETNVLDIFNRNLNSKNDMTKNNNTNVILDLRKMVEENKTISEGSKKVYFTVISNFGDYLKENGYKRISWNELEYNTKLLLNYSQWLYNSKSSVKHKITKEKHLPLSVITINNRITVICTLLTNAKDRELTNISDDVINKLRRTKTDNDKTYEHQIALYDEEIEAISKLEINGIMEKAKDLFLFLIEVGQRYEDINGISPIIEYKEQNGKKGAFFRIFQDKTKKYVYPPCTNVAKKIYDKYNGKLPSIPIQKMDLLLKDIARASRITRLCECNETRGGKIYTYQVEGWKLIGTHTGRRTFITRWKRKGMPIDDIMMMTGHTSTETAKRYNRITNDEIGFKFLDSNDNINTDTLVEEPKEYKEVTVSKVDKEDNKLETKQTISEEITPEEMMFQAFKKSFFEKKQKELNDKYNQMKKNPKV